MRVYATSADAWPTSPPGNADQLLRDASRVVDRLLLGRVYDTDASGLPTDPDVTAALRDATVAIATEADNRKVYAAGATQQWQSVKIGSVALTGPQAAEVDMVVLGLPVPAPALIALASVGTFQVDTVARYSRPLDRVTL